ncbi:MAG: PIG-L family deacetylase [Muribaculaceae bacterium]|nr:PIG-L family deacetylase [Muribaculaceae bacterium]
MIRVLYQIDEMMTRREMLKSAGAMTMATVLGGIPLASAAEEAVNAKSKRKILVIGAHPDDPETCAGGTMCLLERAGHEVVSVYLTRGEAGIEGKSHAEAAAIRVVESENACRVMGVRHIFMSQTDGNTEVNLARYKEMRDLIEQEHPDVVITHWPLDGHRDHAACGMLVMDAWRRLGRNFKLYYCEAMSGTQSQMFHPTHWVDITSVQELKHKACLCHESQGMQPLLDEWHIPMERFRGLECRCAAAEAFALHTDALATL